MNALHTRSVASSSADMSDLDGFSLPADYNYGMQQHLGGSVSDDFGFDPPSHSGYPKLETYSPTDNDVLQLPSWPASGFNSRDAVQPGKLSSLLPDNDMQFSEMDRMITNNIPNQSAAISRFGQVTPPRSNSASSEEKSAMSPTSTTSATAADRRKRGTRASKAQADNTVAPTTSGRKRKSTRKASVVSDEQDDKRRQSLEKNRLAAAKCRINKKEKTEQLQRDSHDKAVHNAFLKEQVMRMKEEVQQMNAVLLSHANCDGCKSPEEIQKHLNNLGNEFFAHHLSSFNYGDFSQLNLPGDLSALESGMPQDFFGHGSDEMMNPPLPDFDEGNDFDVRSPMQTD